MIVRDVTGDLLSKKTVKIGSVEDAYIHRKIGC